MGVSYVTALFGRFVEKLGNNPGERGNAFYFSFPSFQASDRKEPIFLRGLLLFLGEPVLLKQAQ